MKAQSFYKRSLLLALLSSMLLLGGCFGGGIDPKDDPIQPSENSNIPANSEENVGEEDAGLNAEAGNQGAGNNLGNNNQGNNPAENNAQGNQAENPGADGEAINNAADENFLNNAAEGEANMFSNNQLSQGNNNLGQGNNNLNQGNNKNLNLGNNNNNFGLAGDNDDGALVNGNVNDILETPSPNVDQGATDNALVEPAPTGESALAPVAGNRAAPTPAMNMGSGGVVRYVTQGGSKLYDKPEGQTVHDLEQGDHPLVNEDGEWARTSDGFYVPTSTLTPSPVPRAKLPKEWR